MPTAPLNTGSFFRESMDSPDYRLIGIKLRLVREVLGMTQADMARKIGTELKVYQHMEAAKNTPDGEKILKLLRAGLHFNPEDTITWVPAKLVEILFPRSR